MEKKTNVWITSDMPGSIPLPKVGLEGVMPTAADGAAEAVPGEWPGAWITPDIPGSIPLPKVGLEGVMPTAADGAAEAVPGEWPGAWITPDIPGSIPLPKVEMKGIDLNDYLNTSKDESDRVEPVYPIIAPEENRIVIDDGIIPIDDPVDPPPVIEIFQFLDQRDNVSGLLEELFSEKNGNHAENIDYAGLISSGSGSPPEYFNHYSNVNNDMDFINITNINDLY